MRNLLTSISIFTLLFFISCERDEMGPGGTAGGGMADSYSVLSRAVLKSLEQNVDSGIVGVNVINSKGEVVLQQNLDTSSLQDGSSIDTSDFSSGIYSFSISTLDGRFIAGDSFIIK